MYAGYLSGGAKRGTALRFTPPGFKHAVDIPFPGRVLPVCARCKKNYKTREHCRTKEQHHTLPWTDTYICMTLDGSCFNPDATLRLEDGPFVAHGVQSQPYIYPDEMKLDPKTPSCAQCKDKNYTRTYCRTSKKHKTLPWSTVYVMLTMSIPPVADYRGTQQPLVTATPSNPSGPGDDSSADKKRKKDDEEAKPETSNGNEPDPKKQKASDGAPEEETVKPQADEKDATGEEKENEDEKKKKEVKEVVKEEEDASPTDIFQNPHSSRTFLCTVSLNRNEVKWVGIDATHVATVMQSRNGKGPNAEAEGMDGGASQMYPSSPYHHMMHPSMGGMGMGGMGMGMHPQMGHFPPMQPNGHGQHPMDGNLPNSADKDENGGENGNGPSQGGTPNQMDNGMHHQQQPWMNQHNHGGMGGHGYPDMMYQQMMDPRAAAMGYGYQPWHGGGGRGGYPMEMGGMPPYSGDGHTGMMQQMGWGGGPPSQQQGGQMHPGGQGGPADMGNLDPGMMQQQQMGWGGPPSQHQGGPPSQHQGGPPSQHQGGPPSQQQGGPATLSPQHPADMGIQQSFQRMQQLQAGVQHDAGRASSNGNENGSSSDKPAGDISEAHI